MELKTNNIMKKFYLLCILMLLPLMASAHVSALQNEEKEPYAVLSDNNTVLTFYYDDQKTARNGMDVGPFSNIDPSWYEHRLNINSVIFDASFANCTTLTSTRCWFYFFENLSSITGIGNLKTDNVTDMSAMFWGCSSLTSLDVTGFKTDNVTDMFQMFRDCSNLTSLDLTGFKTDNVTDMRNMFKFCSGLTSLDLPGFKNSNVTNMSEMFYGCSDLTSLDLTGFKTDNVTSMSGMFWDCSGLTSLDVTGFKTDKVKDMGGMFCNCSGLTTIYAGDGWSTAKVTNSGSMLYGCTSLVGGAGTTYDADHTDHAYAHIDGGSSNPGYFTDKDATINLCPDNNHPHVIDLGLPSGTKWACCNIGASEPYVFGNEYAWGETETKSKYTWETYIYCNGSKETCQDIGTNIAKTEYDVAHVKWGGSYQIPSVDDVKELIDNCTKRSVTYEGIYYTGPNGNTIFVPSRMYGWGDDTGHHGNYWTSDLSDELHIAMNWFVWESVYPAKWNNIGREAGFFVRPVAKGSGESPTEETDVDEITIKDIGKTTWCSEYDLDFTNVAGIKAYTATGYDNIDKTIWLTRVMKVPAGTGILVKGDAGIYKIPHAKVQSAYANWFVGNLGATISIAATDGDKTNYYLSGKDGSFVSVNGSANIGTNKAYLQLPTSVFAGTRSIGISYDDEDGTTSIRDLTPALSEGDGAWYTLQGQRVAKPNKGLYIHNGKKVIIK